MSEHIYVLSSKSNDKRFKVGRISGTYKDLTKRYNTYIPDLVIHRFVSVNDSRKEEKRLHRCLDKFRMRNANNRQSEWFECSLDIIDSYLVGKCNDLEFLNLLYEYSGIKGISIFSASPLRGRIALKGGIWYEINEDEDLSGYLEHNIDWSFDNLEPILSSNVFSDKELEIIEQSVVYDKGYWDIDDGPIRRMFEEKILRLALDIVPESNFRDAICLSASDTRPKYSSIIVWHQFIPSQRLIRKIGAEDHIINNNRLFIYTNCLDKVSDMLKGGHNPMTMIMEHWISRQDERQSYHDFCRACILGEHVAPLVLRTSDSRQYPLYRPLTWVMSHLYGESGYHNTILYPETKIDKDLRLLIADQVPKVFRGNLITLSRKSGIKPNRLSGSRIDEEDMFERHNPAKNVFDGTMIDDPFFSFIAWCLCDL